MNTLEIAATCFQSLNRPCRHIPLSVSELLPQSISLFYISSSQPFSFLNQTIHLSPKQKSLSRHTWLNLSLSFSTFKFSPLAHSPLFLFKNTISPSLTHFIFSNSTFSLTNPSNPKQFHPSGSPKKHKSQSSPTPTQHSHHSPKSTRPQAPSCPSQTDLNQPPRPPWPAPRTQKSERKKAKKFRKVDLIYTSPISGNI